MVYIPQIEDCDGLYTSDTGVLLTHVYADCAPLSYLHQKIGKIGIAHAGWRGTALGIAGEMIKLWKQQDNIDPSEIEVVIGPALCPDCSIVIDDLVDEIKVNSDKNKISEALYYDVEGNVHLDMQTANEIHLVRNGVKLENTYKTKFCPSCSDNFFSHLKDNGNIGRMMGYIGWNQG